GQERKNEPMTEKKIEAYRTQLRELAGQVQHDAWAVEEQIRLPAGGAGTLSNAPMHLADYGTEANLQDTNGVLLENERYILNEARGALGRTATGASGRCAHCGAPIGEERLDAIPYVRTCRSCSEALNEGPRLNLDSGRPADEIATIAASEKLVDSGPEDDG